MRPWARWTAKTALVAVGFAAAGGGLSGTALAGTGGDGPSGAVTVFGSALLGPASIPAEVCDDVSGLLGIAAAGCGGGATSSAGSSRAAGDDASGVRGSGNDGHAPVSTQVKACGNTAAGIGASASSCGGGANSAAPHTHAAIAGASGDSAASTAFAGATTSGPGHPALRPTFGDTLNAPGLGAGASAASQLAGPGALPGLADLPSQNGPGNLPGHDGATGGSTLMAGSAAGASGMSSDSFAALAIGALLAGGAALKIASRRARDRKAGIGATI
jgi:hypothetical protein